MLFEMEKTPVIMTVMCFFVLLLFAVILDFALILMMSSGKKLKKVEFMENPRKFNYTESTMKTFYCETENENQKLKNAKAKLKK